VVAELERLAAAGAVAVYFVDDNFIGNQKAVLELLPHVIEWQQRNRYPLRLSCEATLNLAKNTRVLELMRQAGFVTVFCGIETPEPEALHAISKDQNLRMPIVEAVRRLNSYGMEVVSGIILGLDSDTPATADRVLEFIQASNIPMLTINILYALPKTPLWSRLDAAGRLVTDASRESNVAFLMPYETVLDMWRRCIATAFEPAFLYRRYAYNQRHTFPNRKAFPFNRQRSSWRNIRRGVAILARLFWRVGLRGDYRRIFWRLAWPTLKAGRIEQLIHIAVVSHHLIEFTRDCVRGTGESSFYSPTPESLRREQPV
jgi:hopanoid C-2 methylase